MSPVVNRVALCQRDLFVWYLLGGFPGGSDCKESAYNAGDPGSMPGLGQSPGDLGNGYPLQYSCLDDSSDKGAWRARVHRFAKSWTPLSNQQFSSVSSVAQSCLTL